ncbi:MAG: membrane protein insertase YidC [Bdellovibrionales bacterium]|nr:membrane protein insertase YidC [Bdellovibrionales bacterium]
MNKKETFFDFKTMFAIALVSVIWFFWQQHLVKKYPENYKNKVSGQSAKKEVAKNNVTPLQDKNLNNQKINNKKAFVKKEKLFFVESKNLSFYISSNGMAVKKISLHKYKDKKNKDIIIGDKDSLFFSSFLYDNENLYFDIKKIKKNQWVGSAFFNGISIKKFIKLNSQNYSIDVSIKIKSTNKAINSISMYTESTLDKETSSFDQFGDSKKIFISNLETKSRWGFSKEDLLEETQNSNKVVSGINVVSLGSRYFTAAFIEKSDLLPNLNVQVLEKQNKAKLVLSYIIPNNKRSLELKYISYFGPKSNAFFSNVDKRLSDTIDFGFFDGTASFILKLLEWIFSFVKNWGVAIILLTVLVRLVLLPINILSFKSMKSMQVVQPKIKALRQKYKDDKVKLNQEMMSLMKNNKVNPLSGCLPMFLQMPIFFALFQVLGESVELYQSPFIFWITDLSLKDPFYLFPVLSGLTIFLQQKMTPSNLEPAQAKIMLMMPIVFTFFMFGLPSGLTLYMFVNSGLGLLQQYYFVKVKA